MIDIALVKVAAGKGGDGSASFRREKYVPKGGPDGGDGGDGGSIYLKADSNLRTLDNFASRDRYQAQSGQAGAKQKRHGSNGEDLVLKVPLGTSVYLLETSQKQPTKHKAMLLAKKLRQSNQDSVELNTSKQQYRLSKFAEVTDLEDAVLVVKGGSGGRGNVHFATSSHQTPTDAESGQPGETKWLILELKLLADVGLIGKPNAGKSTLLSVLTRAKPKIADYQFTTLEPNLGVINDNLTTEIVIADVPGLIEGASQGKGLGDEFLRHIERCHHLVHVLAPDPNLLLEEEAMIAQMKRDYSDIRNELAEYSPVLEEKTEIVVLNKIDTLIEIKPEELAGKLAEAIGVDRIITTSAAKSDVDRLKQVLVKTPTQASGNH